MTARRRRTPARPFFQAPWALIPLFTATLYFVSSPTLASAYKPLLIALFLVLPMAWAVSRPLAAGSPDPLPGDAPGPSTGFALPVVLVLGVGLRFLLYDKLYVWPNADEAMNGILAWDLARSWRWEFFWSFGEVPPLMTYLLALGVQWKGLTHGLMWALPAAVSALTLPAAWLAVRAVTGTSFSLLYAALFSFSFWPLYSGRFCHQGVFLPLWACLVVWALARRLQSPASDPGSAVRLGLVLGSGSLLFTGWPPLALLALATALSRDLRRPGGVRGALFLVGSFLLALLPFLVALATEGYGSHLRHVSAFNGYFPPARILLTMVSYFTALFGGVLVDGAAYVAPTGGMTTPLVGALALLGLTESLRRHREPVHRFALTATLAAMLPGLLSMNVQMYRVATVLPFLVFFSALGARLLSNSTGASLRVPLAVLLMALVLAGDSVRLLKPYFVPWLSPSGALVALQPGRQVPFFLAYRAFETRAERFGPGRVFPAFTPPYNDASLFTSTRNRPELDDPDRPAWIGFVVNVHYAPSLMRRFPKAEWSRLEEGRADDGGLMLFIAPVGSGGLTRAELERFTRVHSALLEADVAQHRLPDGGPYRSVLPLLEKARAEAQADPFLRAIWWEKVEHVHYADVDYEADVAALEAALASGPPLAHLYYKLGSIRLRKLDFERARIDLKTALSIPGQETRAAEALKMLEDYQALLEGRRP